LIPSKKGRIFDIGCSPKGFPLRYKTIGHIQITPSKEGRICDPSEAGPNLGGIEQGISNDEVRKCFIST